MKNKNLLLLLLILLVFILYQKGGIMIGGNFDDCVDDCFEEHLIENNDQNAFNDCEKDCEEIYKDEEEINNYTGPAAYNPYALTIYSFDAQA